MSFAFKIDKALRANLYKICRLCGIDRDEKVPILNKAASEIVNLDDELELYQKIDICLGLKVSKDDKMPQSICILCMDKVNDFYEFREMCFASNVQTRKLLGLKCDEVKKNISVAAIVDIKPDIQIKDEPKRPRKRKTDEVPGKGDKQDVKDEAKKQKITGKTSEKIFNTKEEIKDEPMDPPSTSTVTSSKARQLCNLCNQRFNNKAKLEQHQAATHVPSVVRYVCTACNETIKKTSDIKNHQLWHKLSKTPYICALCGESLMSTYAYSRHLKDHSQGIPAALFVLDRECPQCHETFVTNFLYNTHACAVRTKKCAGCNRQQRSEAEYVRHAATCVKTYLNYSKHIPAAAVAAESCVRIKNENDVEEAAAAEAFCRHSDISLDMTPIVSLTRLSSPLLSSANHCGTLLENSGAAGAKNTSVKKGAKKGVSKKDLKRVDDLLKSTIDAFVSIKHEPEVHVETDIHSADTECEGADENESLSADFHHGDDDGDDADDNLPAICSVKLEELDGSYKDNIENAAGVNIKKEVTDVDDAEEPANKMPMLKLKIKKEHGQLNSSLVDDECNKADKKKKKKKRKEIEKIKEKTLDKNQNSQASLTSEQISVDMDGNVIMPQPGIISIKQEKIDDDIPPPSLHIAQPEATVMTSIPRMQFQIACISSGVEFSGENEDNLHAYAETQGLKDAPTTTLTIEEQEDVKPNRMALDRMLQISNISSGVDMNEDADSESKTDETIDASNFDTTEDTTSVDLSAKRDHKFSAKKPKKMLTAETSTVIYNPSGRTGRGKAFKSTAGVPRAENGNVTNAMPLIVSVSSGSDVPPIHEENKPEEDIQMVGGVYIKPEPRGRGYSDEVHNVENMDSDYSSSAQHNGFMIQEMDEQTYINSIDFNNVQIKQEKDIEVSEVQLSSNDIVANASPNGFKAIKRKRKYTTKYNRNESQNSGSTVSKEPNSMKQGEESEVEEDVEEEEESELSEEEEEEEEEEDEDDDEEEDVNGEPVEEEVREYRELEMPPPLITAIDKANTNEQEEDVAGNQASDSNTPPTFMITNVCSQATEINTAMSMEEPQISTVEGSRRLKIDIISSGCTDLVFDNAPSTDVQNEVALGEEVNSAVEVKFVEKSKSKLNEENEAVEEKSSEIIEQKEESLKAVEIEMGEKSIICEVHGQQEAKLKAQPFFETTPTTSNADGIVAHLHFGDENPMEEQQNLLNHEMAEHAANFEDNIRVQAAEIPELAAEVPVDTTTITALQLHPYLEDISSSSGSVFECASSEPVPTTSTASFPAVAKVNNEETDNFINEQQQQQQQQQQDPQVIHPVDTAASASISNRRGNLSINHHMVLDDSNINEIAENNNNANIERELQDDVAAAARLQQEQQLQQQHNAANHDINS